MKDFAKDGTALLILIFDLIKHTCIVFVFKTLKYCISRLIFLDLDIIAIQCHQAMYVCVYVCASKYITINSRVWSTGH